VIKTLKNCRNFKQGYVFLWNVISVPVGGIFVEILSLGDIGVTNLTLRTVTSTYVTIPLAVRKNDNNYFLWLFSYQSFQPIVGTVHVSLAQVDRISYL